MKKINVNGKELEFPDVDRNIKLGGKQYTLPEIDFQVMYDLGELGFDFAEVPQLRAKSTRFLTIVVAYLTGLSLPKAVTLINNSIKEKEISYSELLTKCLVWLFTSDFFLEQAREALGQTMPQP